MHHLQHLRMLPAFSWELSCIICEVTYTKIGVNAMALDSIDLASEMDEVYGDGGLQEVTAVDDFENYKDNNPKVNVFVGAYRSIEQLHQAEQDIIHAGDKLFGMLAEGGMEEIAEEVSRNNLAIAENDLGLARDAMRGSYENVMLVGAVRNAPGTTILPFDSVPLEDTPKHIRTALMFESPETQLAVLSRCYDIFGERDNVWDELVADSQTFADDFKEHVDTIAGNIIDAREAVTSELDAMSDEELADLDSDAKLHKLQALETANDSAAKMHYMLEVLEDMANGGNNALAGVTTDKLVDMAHAIASEPALRYVEPFDKTFIASAERRLGGETATIVMSEVAPLPDIDVELDVSSDQSVDSIDFDQP